jgi:hypothetical protein
MRVCALYSSLCMPTCYRRNANIGSYVLGLLRITTLSTIWNIYAQDSDTVCECTYMKLNCPVLINLIIIVPHL